MDRHSKRCYKRSTPVGRLRRNAQKIARHAKLVLFRLNSWSNGEADKRTASCRLIVNEIWKRSLVLNSAMGLLEKTGFVPPKRSSSMQFNVGQHVTIAPKYLDKYRQVFASVLKEDSSLLNDLVVETVLSSSEVVIRRGKRTPFLVAKSHLILLKHNNGNAAKK